MEELANYPYPQALNVCEQFREAPISGAGGTRMARSEKSLSTLTWFVFVFSGGRAVEGFVSHIRLLFPVSSPDKLNTLEGDTLFPHFVGQASHQDTVQECIFHLLSLDLEVKEQEEERRKGRENRMCGGGRAEK